MWRLILSILVTLATPELKPSIAAFKRDAEKAIGKPIKVVDANLVVGEGGETNCEQNPVLIKIGSNNSPEFKQLVLAHELGHVMVCSRGFKPWVKIRISTTPPIIRPIMPVLGGILSSCYIEPLANAEAEKRGFNMNELDAMAARDTKIETKSEVHNRVNELAVFTQDLAALGVYCMEVRSKKALPEVERRYANEQVVLVKLESLKTRIGTPTCSDVATCYYWTKKLRDEFSWANYVKMQNPTTDVME
jgi:hypothetical protein